MEISAHVCATSCRAFHDTPEWSCDRCVFARAGPPIFHCVVDLRRARRVFERLDHLLGRDRLVRRARCVRLVAVGVVGSGTRPGSKTDEMEISMAGAVCLSGCYRRLSLHGLDAGAFDRVVVDQVVRRDPQHHFDFAIVFRRASRAGTFCASVVVAS